MSQTLREQIIQIMDLNPDKETGGVGQELIDYFANRLEGLFNAEIIAELERLPVMRKGLHTPQKELDIILADTVRQRIAKLKAKETQL